MSLRTTLNEAYDEALEHATMLIRENALEAYDDQHEILRDDVYYGIAQDHAYRHTAPSLLREIADEAIADAFGI